MSLSDVKIVTDSSADLTSLSELSFAQAPLKIVTSTREYVDDVDLNVDEMIDNLETYNGKSSTSCPSPDDWSTAFGDAKYIFCITITSNLSGSYNTACIAKQDYEEQHPDRRVFVLDSLSAGPELQLIADKIKELVEKGYEFDEICEAITQYSKRTGLLFVLASMKNLANNGRVSPFVAKAAGLLGIRVVGKASDKGDLEPLEKCRGENKALSAIVNLLKKLNHNGKKIKIGHVKNQNAADKLKQLILAEFKNAEIEIYRCRGLCSFYAENGGLLIGFEKAAAL